MSTTSGSYDLLQSDVPSAKVVDEAMKVVVLRFHDLSAAALAATGKRSFPAKLKAASKVAAQALSRPGLTDQERELLLLVATDTEESKPVVAVAVRMTIEQDAALKKASKLAGTSSSGYVRSVMFDGRQSSLRLPYERGPNSRTVRIFMSPEEAVKLTQESQVLGMTVSSHIRHSLFGEEG